MGGSVPIVFSYFSEFFSSRLRDTLIIGLASFWTVGRLYASFVAWVVIPRSISFHMGHMLITSWRVFLALCTLPCFLSALAIVFLTESPGFLFYVSTTVYRRVCVFVCNVYRFGVSLYSVVVLVMEVGIVGGNPLCVLCLCSSPCDLNLFSPPPPPPPPPSSPSPSSPPPSPPPLSLIER